MTYLERRFSSRWRQQSGTRYIDRDKHESLEDVLDRVAREAERGAA
jgi:hypothetical protein